jgi:hypothetical protein
MKYYSGLLALLISASSYGQTDKLSITLCPLAAADIFSFPTIQAGVEYRFTPKISWYNEFGVEYARSFIALPDSVVLRPHGIKVKTELRYYFHPGTAAGHSGLSGQEYVAINGFLTSDTHNTEVLYHYKGDTSTRTDVFGVRKKVWGMNVVYGREQLIGKRFGLDWYVGAGIRLRYITTVGQQFNYKSDLLEGPIDYNIAFEREKTDAAGGFSTTANLTAGIMLFYRL